MNRKSKIVIAFSLIYQNIIKKSILKEVKKVYEFKILDKVRFYKDEKK